MGISLGVRCYSSSTKRASISIVGSGPSGFYTAYRLLNESPIPLHIRLWERLPTPFGLSRYGIAPDHPEVKNCEETFTECARQFSQPGGKHLFEFIGGVTIGQEVKLAELLRKQDAVILSYGCSGDKKLRIPGEADTRGVFSSREFVNWYNGHPDVAMSDKLNNFEWNKVKRVGIIGNGNVALDVARVLISNQIKEIWDKTDISPVALANMRKAPVENIKIIARRDFAHSKFTNKELRELWELEKYGILGHIDKEYFQENMFELQKYDRAFKRSVEMCSEYLKPFSQRTKKSYKKASPPSQLSGKTWELDYLKSPLSIKQDKFGKIKSLVLSKNRVSEGNRVELIPGQEVIYDLDLLITSLGYAGTPLAEFNELKVKFDRDHVANIEGRVLRQDGQVYPRLYATGWIRKGSQGVIVATMMDAFQVADQVIQDITQLHQPATNDHFDLTHVKYTTWNDWEKINEQELREGRAQHKSRAKFLTIQEIMSSI